MKRVCVLKPMEAGFQTIPLNAGTNTVGRCNETAIRDYRCSKRQLEIDVNLEQGRIKLKVLGLNPSSVNGIMVMQNGECEMLHGDLVELIYGRYPFELIFQTLPEEQLTYNREDNLSEISCKNATANSKNVTESWGSTECGQMLIFTSNGANASEKVAAYDIDGTIIKTKSGNVFPKNVDDWQLNFTKVPAKLKCLYENGYKICFFTNQGGIAKGKIKLGDFKQKILQILRKLGVPAQVFVSIANGYFRKPLPGMWEYMREHKNGEIKLQLNKCFYVGDAAGRPKIDSGIEKRKKDHSLVDRLFAANIGVSFYTPEEHFLDKKTEHWSKLEFEPSVLHDKVPLLEPTESKLVTDKTEMIIMVGLPGAGKSHFVDENLVPLGYCSVNADTLGSTKSCFTACERVLRQGQSCVVDNTNIDVEARKKFVELAERMQVPCRCFVMSTTLAQVKHNIVFRDLTETTHSKINDFIFNAIKKRYKTPTLDEGFKQIVNVNFKPKFSGVHEERLYKLYLVEK